MHIAKANTSQAGIGIIFCHLSIPLHYLKNRLRYLYQTSTVNASWHDAEAYWKNVLYLLFQRQMVTYHFNGIIVIFGREILKCTMHYIPMLRKHWWHPTFLSFLHNHWNACMSFYRKFVVVWSSFPLKFTNKLRYLGIWNAIYFTYGKMQHAARPGAIQCYN